MIPSLNELSDAWKDRDGFVVITTINQNNTPHAEYVVNISLIEEGIFVAASENLDKTRANIRNHSQGTLLFMTNAYQAYQVKGSLEIMESGEAFREYLNEFDSDLSSDNLIIFHITEAFSEDGKIY
ncbi:MAG: pyridoxamine 5'-phosphate oxidase family protein [Anaerolineaceae bacterium]|nr:pyridoxamine 5'-phosphate oxidase family protein [Anaerolineaceae bacterium]